MIYYAAHSHSPGGIIRHDVPSEEQTLDGTIALIIVEASDQVLKHAPSLRATVCWRSLRSDPPANGNQHQSADSTAENYPTQHHKGGPWQPKLRLHGRIGRATRGRAWRHRPPDLSKARRLMIHQLTPAPRQCSTKMLRARPHHMLKRPLVTLQTVGTWGH